MDIPTPLAVDVDELEAIHARIAASGRSVEGRRQVDIPTVRRGKLPSAETLALETLDTIATRPIETPVRAREVPRRVRPPAIRGVVIVAGAAVVAVAGFFALKAREVPPSAHAPVIVPSGTSIPAPIAVAPVPSAPPSTGASAASLTSSSAPIAHVPTAATPPAGAAPSAAAAAKANMMLLGEPGTRVLVDGVSRGACPLKLTLDPGAHEVRFTFDPTGESLGERVTVKSGDHVTVRATFTGATPTVKVLR